MASFQLVGLSPAAFAPLFDLSDAQLAERCARRVEASEYPGYPCRVSLRDAEVGEELLLLPYDHQPAASAYRASGPIYVRRGAAQSILPPGVIPEQAGRRLLSIRAYDAEHLITVADVAEGPRIAETIEQFFADEQVDYIHLHYAKRGCFFSLARRA